MRKAIGDDAAYLSFHEALFEKIGMKSASLNLIHPVPYRSSYIYATMRDYTRFGLLYLNKGNWLGEQTCLKDGWNIQRLRLRVLVESMEPVSGSTWQARITPTYHDMFCCRGHDGQFIYIIPSKHLVIVRTGFSRKDEFDQNRFISGILETLDYF